MNIKKKLVQIKDEYLTADVVIPAAIGSIGAGVAYYIGLANGYKYGVKDTFVGLSKMLREGKQ